MPTPRCLRVLALSGLTLLVTACGGTSEPYADGSSSLNGGPIADATTFQGERIQPYSENPAYWQYEGDPILLRGGTDTDAPFQMKGLEAHLDSLAARGGNYVRNTMAYSRSDDAWPFLRTKDGRFDLDRPNPEFFDRLERLLRLAHERGIIVQIEVWATWNYYAPGGEGYPKRGWNVNPFNALNNVNYPLEETGLPDSIDYSKSEYPGEHTFFYTRPSEEDLPAVLEYQQAFVDRLLEVALPYPNVLYCMNNETNEAHSWGQYWASYIRDRAEERGIDVETGDMYDINALTHPRHRQTLDDPSHTFVDVSQNNFNLRESHYEFARYVREYGAEHGPKPVNNTKIYGGSWGYDYGDAEEGVARFMRNLFAGAATMRFHRRSADPYAEDQENYYGLGLGPEAEGVLASTEMLLGEFEPWRAEPSYDGLFERSRNEAYLMSDPGRRHAVYFTDGGSVMLDLRQESGTWEIRWLDVMGSRWTADESVEGGAIVDLATPGSGDWVALVSRE